MLYFDEIYIIRIGIMAYTDIVISENMIKADPRYKMIYWGLSIQISR